ncbi:hypothetical protein SAMN05216227_100731 [Pseudorhodobacter antarcticus]|uniref:Divergent polysaccharide deacetylase n=1 Tax=Pseudorhodobacter antarcticus TaxID=1077947 RepID=A0A1H8DJH7_9RHOB|nr:polysaccharide deacteylase family 2 protein [Pseudorhodobacter antarcticus]SEN07481.1 hypothetical protein SAMN05216227_100731 [Pseudorhodobacter antarcticus]
MSRGFLVGAGWGTAAAAVGLVVASQVADLPLSGAGGPHVAVEVAQPPVGAAQMQVADEKAVDAAPNAPDAAVPAMSLQGAAEAVPDVGAPTGGDAAPVVALPPIEMPPVAGSDRAATPETARDAVPDIVSETQTAMLAPTSVGAAATVPVAPATQATAPNLAAPAQSLPETPVAESAPSADMVPRNEPAFAPTVDPAPVAVAPETAPESALEFAPEPEPMPEVAVVDAARPAPGFAGKVEGVKTGRLPSIGAAPDQVADEPAEAATVVLVDDPSLPAIERFAAGFQNPDNKPLFAILLQDTGGPDIDREALAKLDFPVSFVIDPTLPDAATAAQIYRAGGKEVLMLATGLPVGATASDLSVSMGVTSAVLPEAVGVVDLETGGFQGNRSLATQVLALIEDEGRGVVSWDKGLNAAAQVAQREGVRHAVIFRSLDSEGEASPLIRRYLDRAAFKAAQDGRVVVAGKTRPETVAALLEWALEGRAATVALAPSTAVMITQ